MTPRSPRVPRARPADAGVTFAELLVVVMLLAMVVGALFPLLHSGRQAQTYASGRQAMIQNGRVALDKLIREMRAAESFRTLTSGDIRFTLRWGDGTGATPTVEYALDGATHNLEYRWSADWDDRQQIQVRAVDAVPAGYAVRLTFNHALLVLLGQSLASGDDVRVRYWNGSAMVELDRVLDPPSAWNSLTTTIWFRLQAPIPAGTQDANYYLYYGNLADANPPAYGPNVFLDYQDGTTLDGWTRRDTAPGTNTPSPADGFVFQAPSGSAHREFTKNVPHSDVEIFWGFWSSLTGVSDGYQTGVSARLSDTGVGYRVTLADQSNTLLRIRYWTTWSTTGGVIGSVPAVVIPGSNYYGRLYLVGSTLQVKYWVAGTPEPGWMLSVIDARQASGNHYGQVDGYAAPMNHRHRTIIVRPRVAREPTITLGPAVSGARPDPLVPLAGEFRSMSVACFDASGNAISCSAPASVRSVQVTLAVMDPAGLVPDITVTDQAFRQIQ